MPQLAFIRGGESKSKVACETAALPLDGVRCCTVSVSGITRPNDPAGSVLLRVRDGVGFVELFGAALRRDGSTKGSSNPKAAPSAAGAGTPRAGSRRRLPAGKAAVVVVAILPAGKAVAQERRRGWRRPAAGARVFASEAVGAAEPASPKVSCFGAVRSERRAAPPEKQEERSGCWASVVTATVRGLCWTGHPREGEPEATESGTTASTSESPAVAVLSPPRPGLGDVKRLASRRWPETMAGEA